jgi:radical SAM superfamily enzyme
MALLQDLENIRADRMRIGMQSVAESVRTGSAVHSVKVCMHSSLSIVVRGSLDYLSQLNNVSSLEIQTIKKFFLEVASQQSSFSLIS